MSRWRDLVQPLFIQRDGCRYGATQHFLTRSNSVLLHAESDEMPTRGNLSPPWNSQATRLCAVALQMHFSSRGPIPTGDWICRAALCLCTSGNCACQCAAAWMVEHSYFRGTTCLAPHLVASSLTISMKVDPSRCQGPTWKFTILARQMSSDVTWVYHTHPWRQRGDNPPLGSNP